MMPSAECERVALVASQPTWLVDVVERTGSWRVFLEEFCDIETDEIFVVVECSSGLGPLHVR